MDLLYCYLVFCFQYWLYFSPGVCPYSRNWVPPDGWPPTDKPALYYHFDARKCYHLWGAVQISTGKVIQQKICGRKIESCFTNEQAFVHNSPTHSIKLDYIVEYGIFPVSSVRLYILKFRTKLPQLIEGYPDVFRKDTFLVVLDADQ